MKKTYKFRLQPSRNQEVVLFTWLTRCRRLYNACLEQRRIAYRSHGISLSRYDQQKQLPELKEGLPEYTDVNAQVMQDVIHKADKSFQSFFRRVRNGEEPGYPRYKSRYRFNSFTYPQAQSVFSLEDGRLKMSKLGDFKLIQHREIPPEAILKTLTIKRDNCGDWWATLSVDVGHKIPEKLPIEKVVGVDVGIAKLATLSTGQFFENKKHIKQQEKKLKLLDRRLSRKKKGSNNRNKARLVRARAYRKLGNQRQDYLHKISRYLVDNFDLIAFEDLTIKNMMNDHIFAKAIGDGAWGMLTQFTDYKAEWAGKTVVKVDPTNTSQECSMCGTIVRKSLAVRVHVCPNCFFSTDRDLNASFNIEYRAMQKIGWEPPELTTPVEIGVQSLENISPWLSRSMKREAIPSTACG